MNKIALNFEDGFTQIIESLPYESVSDAAYRQGVNIPIDCADGACGTCKCKIRSGNFDAGDYIEEALTNEEFENGLGLACQMVPKSDLVIDIFASSEACKIETKTVQAIITELEKLSDEIIKLNVCKVDDTAINFLPGQYANIEVPGAEGQTRSYSFSNKPEEVELEFLIKLVQDGLMSNFLKHKANVGQHLNLTGPTGTFYLREIQRPTLFFAGGTGIAPFLSMLEKLAAENKALHPIELFYGARTHQNLVETQRLKAFKEQINFDYKVCISKEPSEIHPTGFVTQWINKEILVQPAYDIYICGPNAMVEAVKLAFDEANITYHNFYLEKFLPSGTNTLEKATS